jgi:hypothetical protein
MQLEVCIGKPSFDHIDVVTEKLNYLHIAAYQ